MSNLLYYLILINQKQDAKQGLILTHEEVAERSKEWLK